MKLKIINLNRFVRSILILIFILLMFIFLSQSSFSHQEIKYKTIYISSGDTIWSIARDELRENKYFQDYSTKEAVYKIQNINKLKSSEIYIGQELLIPVK